MMLINLAFLIVLISGERPQYEDNSKVGSRAPSRRPVNINSLKGRPVEDRHSSTHGADDPPFGFVEPPRPEVRAKMSKSFEPKELGEDTAPSLVEQGSGRRLAPGDFMYHRTDISRFPVSAQVTYRMRGTSVSDVVCYSSQGTVFALVQYSGYVRARLTSDGTGSGLFAWCQAPFSVAGAIAGWSSTHFNGFADEDIRGVSEIFMSADNYMREIFYNMGGASTYRSWNNGPETTRTIGRWATGGSRWTNYVRLTDKARGLATHVPCNEAPHHPSFEWVDGVNSVVPGCLSAARRKLQVGEFAIPLFFAFEAVAEVSGFTITLESATEGSLAVVEATDGVTADYLGSETWYVRGTSDDLSSGGIRLEGTYNPDTSGAIRVTDVVARDSNRGYLGYINASSDSGQLGEVTTEGTRRPPLRINSGGYDSAFGSVTDDGAYEMRIEPTNQFNAQLSHCQIVESAAAA